MQRAVYIYNIIMWTAPKTSRPTVTRIRRQCELKTFHPPKHFNPQGFLAIFPQRLKILNKFCASSVYLFVISYVRKNAKFYSVAFDLDKVLHGSAPRYLGPFAAVANLPGRRTLRSGGTSRLIVPSVRRSTVGDRAFSVAGPRVWNTLPEEIMTSQSLLTFRQQLKTWLFRKSYPDIIIWTRIYSTLQLTLK